MIKVMYAVDDRYISDKKQGEKKMNNNELVEKMIKEVECDHLELQFEVLGKTNEDDIIFKVTAYDETLESEVESCGQHIVKEYNVIHEYNFNIDRFMSDLIYFDDQAIIDKAAVDLDDNETFAHKQSFTFKINASELN